MDLFSMPKPTPAPAPAPARPTQTQGAAGAEPPRSDAARRPSSTTDGGTAGTADGAFSLDQAAGETERSAADAPIGAAEQQLKLLDARPVPSLATLAEPSLATVVAKINPAAGPAPADGQELPQPVLQVDLAVPVASGPVDRLPEANRSLSETAQAKIESTAAAAAALRPDGTPAAPRSLPTPPAAVPAPAEAGTLPAAPVKAPTAAPAAAQALPAELGRLDLQIVRSAAAATPSAASAAPPRTELPVPAPAAPAPDIADLSDVATAETELRPVRRPTGQPTAVPAPALDAPQPLPSRLPPAELASPAPALPAASPSTIPTTRTSAEGGEPLTLGASASGGPTQAAPQTQAPSAAPVPGATASAETARVIAPQIASVLGNTGAGDRITLRLDPPELGTVEIAMDVTDQGLRATLSAERPATGDLIRRHAEILLQEFNQAGFADVDLQFASHSGQGGGEGGSAQSQADPFARAWQDGEDGLAAAAAVAAHGDEDGLDLRF
ncbi:MAG: flagellar hook-length control protein FliK [Pseudomonadota bacterium]